MKSGNHTRMKISLFLMLILLTITSIQAGELLVVATINSPCKTPQDLAWDGKLLWMVDDSSKMIYGIEQANGSISLLLNSPSQYPAGLTFDGSSLRISDNSTRKIYKIDPASGRVDQAIDLPEMELNNDILPLGGLAWDGNHLWCGLIAGWSSRISQLTEQGKVEKYYFTKGYPLGVESDGKFLWTITDNGGLRSGILYQYDISTGLYVTHFDTPCEFPVGLAYDGQHFWTIDREKNVILKLKVK